MKPAQYSFEFIMTYGWAFLIITVMLAAIYAYGFLDLSGVLPEKCEFFGQVECTDYQLSSAGANVSIVVLNNFNADLVILNATATGNPDTFCETTGAPIPWDLSTEELVVMENCVGTAFVADQRTELRVHLDFYNPETCSVGDTTCHHTAIGSIHAKIK